jgi:phosphoglycerate dehydrogenase-like enzyme
MTPAVLIALDPRRVGQARLSQVRALAPGRQVVVGRELRVLEEILPAVEIVAGHPPAGLLSRAPRLRWVQAWSAGVDRILERGGALPPDLVLTTAAGVHAVPVSEHALAMILAFARGLHRVIPARARKDWLRVHGRELFEVHGRTLLIVGLGAIGAHLARRARGLGMEVIGIRRNPDRPVEGVGRLAGPERLPELLPLADFVVLILPLTPRTRGLIGRAELARMKPGAYLFNLGRGGVVREADLVEALRGGTLAGAGLDVFEREPLPADSPLWELDNVILTPHYAGMTPEYQARAWDLFLENLKRYMAGQPLRNRVDREAGY